MYFDILNRVGLDHECDRRTDGRTDRQTEPRLAIARYNSRTRNDITTYEVCMSKIVINMTFV